MTRSAIVVLCLAGALAGCAGGGRVTRIADGIREEGRYIDPVAYSAYARGALLEAAGEHAAAREAYRQALSVDEDSAEIHARIGAVSCALFLRGARSELGTAERAFKRAVSQDPTLSTAYYERANCLRQRGHTARALVEAQRAVAFDPRQVGFSRLVAELLVDLGRPQEAWLWLDALASREPDSPEVWAAYRNAAERVDDAVRLRRAVEAEGRLGIEPPRRPVTDSEDIDAFLRTGDLAGARSLAVSRRWRPSELALRAVELGALELGFEQGMLVLRADPTDADAWVAALVAADRSRDDERFRAALFALGSRPEPPSPRAAELYAAFLAERAGGDAAAAFRESLARAPRREP